MERPIILLSGGFDPYHSGHAKMFEAAAQLGDICVILNSDKWLDKKKGSHFMKLWERAEVLNSINGVKWVWQTDTLDDVSGDIYEITQQMAFRNRLLVFAKGGDRTPDNTPELKRCKELNIPVIFGLGGGKTQSSSDLLKRWTDQKIDDLTDISSITVFNTEELEIGRFDG